MSTRPTILALAFVLTSAGTVALTTSCAQPELACTSAHGHFAAEYTLVEGDPASPCAQLEGDVLGLQTYFQPGGPNGTPNYEDALLAIRPESLGILIAGAEDRGAIVGDEVFYDANAIGPFGAGYPNDDNLCVVEELAPATVSLPAIDAIPDDPETPDVDESVPAQPGTDIGYRWSDARILVTADAQGTQFEADLVYTRDGCSAEYHVVGVYPAVECESDAECDDDRNGINPDFALRCNTGIGLCVLAGDIPAYE